MKKKSIFLVVILCIASLFGVFGITACGETSISTVNGSYEKLLATYERYDKYLHTEKVSESEEDGNLQFTLQVKLGANIQSQSGRDEYKALSLYEDILELANDYILSNKDYVVGLNDKDLPKAAQNALKTLNSQLGSYTGEISTFVSEMNDFDAFLGRIIDNGKIQDSDLEKEKVNLLPFKQEYGRLVSKSVSLSTAVANFVEETGVFKIIKNNVPTTKNLSTLKNYIRIKLLPIFSKYKLNKIENSYDYYSKLTDHGTAYDRVDDQLERLVGDQGLFLAYKNKLLIGTVSEIEGDNETKTRIFNQIFEKAEKFFTEQADFFTAVDGIDFSALAQLGYDSKSYSAKNANFYRYMDKIDTFLGIDVQPSNGHRGTLENFIYEISEDLGIN